MEGAKILKHSKVYDICNYSSQRPTSKHHTERKTRDNEIEKQKDNEKDEVISEERTGRERGGG